MSFASVDDIAIRLKRPLTGEEIAAGERLIEDATGLIAAAAGRGDSWADELDPVPRPLRTICVEAATRALVGRVDDVESESETLGQHTLTTRYRGGGGRVEGDDHAASGVMLTRAEERAVRRAVGGSFRSATLESPYRASDDDSSSMTSEELPL